MITTLRPYALQHTFGFSSIARKSKETAIVCSLVNLWCQVELHVAIVCVLQLILHHERRIWAQSQLHSAGQRSRLCKGYKIAQGEGGSDSLVNCQRDSLFWLLCFSWLQHDVSCANISLNAEANTILACLDLHGFAKLLKVAADLQELGRRKLCNHLVLLLWDFHVFTFNLHELQLKVGDAIVLSTLTLEVDSVCIILPPKLQGVSWSAHLEDLAKRIHVHPKRCCTVTFEVCKCRFAEEQRNKRDMRAVHRLHLKSFFAAVKVNVLAQVLHGIDDLLEKDSL